MKLANDTVFDFSTDFMQTSERILSEVEEFRWIFGEIKVIVVESERERERERERVKHLHR